MAPSNVSTSTICPNFLNILSTWTILYRPVIDMAAPAVLPGATRCYHAAPAVLPGSWGNSFYLPGDARSGLGCTTVNSLYWSWVVLFLSIVQNYIPQKTKFRKELNSAKLHSARSRPRGMCGIFYKVSKFYLSAVYLNLQILTAPARSVSLRLVWDMSN